ncbi:MAG: 5-oxoprolinase/urea amidolyase family protein, partial [Endomicrobium sp.]|nr:5-oxoprolinase/urea amidolyase family protein [Endomicrobium sp.]
MFKKVLIANRGVIAVRIERTLKKMGVKSVAVYTQADAESLHVANADEAFCIGEGPVKESYLNAELILKVAKETGAEAIHAGYGFLSENAEFASLCADNGIVFIGPSPSQMKLFGLKHSAREIAQKAGVPVLTGSSLLKNIDEAKAAAKSAGYPVMLKSTAGGGGIGMKICENEAELILNFEAVTRLAASNFKDGGVFVEKYIKNARHIEAQIFGSRSGKIYVFGERDCSIQRRNQKVVEETPAPDISQDIRLAMHNAAKKLAKTAGYTSAGTVEFLYDADEKKFYFLEVNARLQVEHGITEEVFGIDLVEMMIKEAAGELGEIENKEPQGVSIQARIYAEDPLADFRPSCGKITKAVFPKNARVETWISDGIVISPLYDPMLAKIIVKGETRDEAVLKLSQALSETKIYAISSNADYLFNLTLQDYYKNAQINTSVLKNFFPKQNALEVIDGGVQSAVQDYPGITGYWPAGVPPCGAMDMFSFRLGNAVLGNPCDAAGLELTLRGGTYKFRAPALFCITGADMNAKLDGKPVALNEAVEADTGDVLEFEESKCGMRAYLLARGGFDVPKILNSRSTFTLGAFGGYAGRALRAGDVIDILPLSRSQRQSKTKIRFSYSFSNSWTIGVIAGPHCDGEFLKEEFLQTLADTKYKVHFNSSRTGVRLIGPAPQWARTDGGQAGLHPSNIHDTAYAVGALDLTGDMPILLGPDGPSLGGFVCPVTVASAELWKLGQLKPGDKVSFKLITLEQADFLKEKQEKFLRAVKDAFQSPQDVSKGSQAVIMKTQNSEPQFSINAANARDGAWAILNYDPVRLVSEIA